MARYVPSRYAITDDVEAVQVVNAGLPPVGAPKAARVEPARARQHARRHDRQPRGLPARASARARSSAARRSTRWGEADDDVLDRGGRRRARGRRRWRRSATSADYHGRRAAWPTSRRTSCCSRELQAIADRVATGRDPKAEKLLARALGDRRGGRPAVARRRPVRGGPAQGHRVLDVRGHDRGPPRAGDGCHRGGRRRTRRWRPTGTASRSRSAAASWASTRRRGRASWRASPRRRRDRSATTARRSRVDRYDLLLTTDVLSEGVNLQQAGRIINYDLPWNPMRLVQRHGRIDRIGSRHREVHPRLLLPGDRPRRAAPPRGDDPAEDRLRGGVGRDRRRHPRPEGASGSRSSSPTTASRSRSSARSAPSFSSPAAIRPRCPGEEYRRRLEIALQDGLVRSTRRATADGIRHRLPVAAGDGARLGVRHRGRPRPAGPPRVRAGDAVLGRPA